MDFCYPGACAVCNAATEGSGTSVESDEWLTKPGTVGKVPEGHVSIRDDDGNEVETGDVGTIYLKAPDEAETRFQYYKDEEKTSKAYSGEYFTLGDMGYVDDDGYLFIVDRIKDLIIRGGFNVFPRDVEDALLEHAAVAAAGVVGRPDEAHGEEVVAFVELRSGCDTDEPELVAYAKKRLGGYKYPREIRILPQVPLTPVGKVDRKALRALAEREE